MTDAEKLCQECADAFFAHLYGRRWEEEGQNADGTFESAHHADWLYLVSLFREALKEATTP